MVQKLQFRDADIYWKSTGKGKTVMLLHGFLESSGMWKGFAEKLAKDFQVIELDLPGHGKSGCIGEIHSMELMAECVKAILDEMRIKSCVLAGHSMGGYVALAFAEKWPEMVNGLSLFQSKPTPDSAAKKRDRKRAIKAIEADKTVFVQQAIPQLFAPDNRRKLQKEIKVQQSIAAQMNGKAMIAALHGMMERKDRTNILKQAGFPVQFILGKQDSAVEFSKIFPLVSLPKESHVLILEEVGHMGWLEAPQLCLNAIHGFVLSINS